MGRSHSRSVLTLATKIALFGVLMSATDLAGVPLQRQALACGGLFCNSRPPDPFAPLPVAQNGENVVFSITKDPAGGAPTLVAHIQIQYTGDAAKFSWVVPVDAAPTLSTGTDRLFSALAGVTQPSYQPTYQTTGTCIQPQYNGSGGSASAGLPGSGGATGGGGGRTAGGAGVTVTFQGAVGPFDAAVVKSDDPTALKTWLTDAGYVISDGAAALIDTYVRENKFFVALKLLNGVGVSSIQPIVLTFRAPEPCVPLRLTAIAANPDMPVLVWVLSDKRVVPRGFYELAIDEARIDWWNNGANYFGPKGLVGLAADEAGGNAFITEYAGPSTVARSTTYMNGQIDLTVLRAQMTPPAYVQQLISMGLSNDTLMLPLLIQYIPMPAALKTMGITDSQFYGNISTYWNQYAFPPYDLAGLTDDISKKIVTPRIDAQMMIDSHPYLTRLNTFISPEEMNQDPFFFESQDLPDVSNVHTAVMRTLCGNMDYMACNAPLRLELQDGRMLWLRAGSKAATCDYRTLDTAGLSTLPAATAAWQRETVGEGNRVVDNSSQIQAGIVANNKKYPAEEAMFPTPTSAIGLGGESGAGGSGMIPTGGVGGAASGTGGAKAATGGTGHAGGTTAPGGSGGGTGGAGGAGAYKANGGGGGGCGCQVGQGTAGGVPALALAWGWGLALIARRRRRGVR